MWLSEAYTWSFNRKMEAMKRPQVWTTLLYALCSDRYGREHAYVRVKRAKGEKEGQKQSDSHYQCWVFNELQVHYFKPVQ